MKNIPALCTLSRAVFAILGLATLPRPASAADIRSGDILVRGVKAEHCNVTVTDDGVTLDLESSTPPGGTKIGSVLQNCNKKAGYTLTVSSVNCLTGSAGGKMISLATIPAENLPYSLTATQPTTGGSAATVTGLLGGGCSGDTYVLMRNVTSEKINAETANVFAPRERSAGFDLRFGPHDDGRIYRYVDDRRHRALIVRARSKIL